MTTSCPRCGLHGRQSCPVHRDRVTVHADTTRAYAALADVRGRIGALQSQRLVLAPDHQSDRLVVDGVVTIHRDGRVELADGVTTDDAAREFWAAVSRVAGWDT